MNALFDYMGRRLLQANLHNNSEYIEEVSRLLGQLSDAWAKIGSSDRVNGASSASPAAPVLSATNTVPFTGSGKA